MFTQAKTASKPIASTTCFPADTFHCKARVRDPMKATARAPVEAGRLKSISHQPNRKATGLP